MQDAFIAEQVAKICKNYKISEEDAQHYVESKLEMNQELKDLIAEENNLKKIYRTRTYKDFIKKAKKEIYFGLRTYQKEGADIISAHISTAERQPYEDSFFSQIEKELSESKVFMDLGGGVFPASFPFQEYNPKKFVWIDKDKISYQKLKEFKEDSALESLELHNDKIGVKEWKEYLGPHAEFDLVFMLKLIPVIARQEKELLKNIANIPTKYVVITGSKEAMVKKQDIEEREDKIIQEFITTTGKNVVKRIDIENEFGYLLS